MNSLTDLIGRDQCNKQKLAPTFVQEHVTIFLPVPPILTDLVLPGSLKI